MNMTFLCANHRVWLTNQPQQAVHCCYNASETGWFFSQDGRWAEALPYFGSAYETAEILLASRVIAHSNALDNFLYTLANLTQTLIKLERTQDCKDVYKVAIERIKQELARDCVCKKQINKQLIRLSLELNALEEGKCAVNSARNTYMYAKSLNQRSMILH